MASLRAGTRYYRIPRRSAAQSEVISNAMECGSKLVEIPGWIDHRTVTLILEYMQFHQQVASRRIALPLVSKRMRDNMCTWDARWVSRIRSRKELTVMLNAADFLGLDAIIDICLCYYSIKYSR